MAVADNNALRMAYPPLRVAAPFAALSPVAAGDDVCVSACDGWDIV
ncbi:MAG: hypothetical protein J0J06_10845 [Sphingomonas sp.]|nr:hypothetical protein [Sphingomonas sp.]MBN8815932.1 hypothetical protein [Sphingomonas sp.]